VSGDYCRGCGVAIQTETPDKPGYVPEVQDQKGQLICQRCYRITHYGEAGTFHPEPGRIRQNIIKAISLSDLLIVVVDFADLAGSLPVWAELLANKPYILIINKIDLLPLRTKQTEIMEYIKQYLKNSGWAAARDIIVTSGNKGSGVDILARRLSKEAAPGSRIAILGVTNVGKSSLIKSLLKMEGSPNAPTVSKFPGTTMGLSNWSILKGRNTLIDTPGLAPDDRIVDLFCPECASALVASAKIEQKLWGLKPGKGLIIGGLCGFEYQGEVETVVIAFTSPEMVLHRTDNSKISTLLDESPAWLTKLCQNCRKKVEWQETMVHIDNNQDLAIAGLGWISLRGLATDFKIRLPKGVHWEVRPALIGKR
jgi:ribosome biogenesis GTPase YqeH